MKNLSLIFLSFALLLSYGCKSQQPTGPVNIWDGKDANVIDETFVGTLPCADCEKIDYKLTLKPDMKWHSSMVYVGRDVKPFEENGHYNVTEDGIVVLAKHGEGMDRFREVPDGLLMLDVSGKEIKDAPAGMFLLKPGTKTQQNTLISRGDTIPDKRLNNIWVMVQLGDSILNPDNFMNGLPMIELSTNRHEVSGHDGCNRIRGIFSTKGNTITFGDLITTKIACPRKNWSQQIAPALNACTYKYSFGKNRLIFKRDNKVIVVLKNID
jgi:copper homeostasis protein (lipoprotein)